MGPTCIQQGGLKLYHCCDKLSDKSSKIKKRKKKQYLSLGLVVRAFLLQLLFR